LVQHPKSALCFWQQAVAVAIRDVVKGPGINSNASRVQKWVDAYKNLTKVNY
jgi:hypothetical protein